MGTWTFQDAELELERVLAMTEEEFQAVLISAGVDPDQAIDVYDCAVREAIERAMLAEP